MRLGRSEWIRMAREGFGCCVVMYVFFIIIFGCRRLLRGRTGMGAKNVIGAEWCLLTGSNDDLLLMDGKTQDVDWWRAKRSSPDRWMATIFD
jgi:hypothetical protein